jgi:hypothetical protein
MTGFADPQKTLIVSGRGVFYGRSLKVQRSAGVTQRQSSRVHERWARLRFSVIGHLLAAPPAKGELRDHLTEPICPAVGTHSTCTGGVVSAATPRLVPLLRGIRLTV